MNRSAILLALVLLASGPGSGGATTIVGDLNNFDTLNDTGQVCYGFEIELDGVHSTDITYTFDWNHYGAPKIWEDTTDPLNPKVFIRYESTKDGVGNWGANGSFTNMAIPSITPPSGHTCTNTSVNEGCEHFGVGYYGIPSTIKYNWLVDGGGGTLAYHGSKVPVAAPKFAYTAPVPGQPANVVAVIPAPVVPILANKKFGEPSWVKVIKTTTHSANPVALQDLISDDTDGDGLANWQNGEPDEVESEWYLLQANDGANAAKAELEGGPDDMGDGSETVTRRYEFYRYGAALDTLDGENGEAMCSEVNPTIDPNDPNYLHGVGNHVAVTDPNGDTYYVDCAAQVVVGNYIGAQMAGFAAAAPLGLIDHLQDGEFNALYTPRTVIVGGNTPFDITITDGNLPPGLAIDPPSGVLMGTPTAGGSFGFTVHVTDADNVTVNKSYTMNILGGVVPPEPCPAGTYSTTGSTPCTPAPAGYYASGTGNTSATPCAAGTFSSTEGAAACTPAPAGSYASGTGNNSARLCAAGSFSSTAGAAACTPAPAGSYAAGTGNTSATPCAAGSFSSAAGAAACTLAPAGSYAAGTGNTSATPCAAGSFSSTKGAAACTLAPAGSYAAGTGNTSATPCPPGTTSDAGASVCTPVATIAQQLSDAIDAALSDKPGLANSMHQQAEGIASAPNANAKAGKLAAFINHVNAQRGKALTSVEADNLIALAKLL